MFFHKKKSVLGYFLKNLATIVGIVLVWRGVWYVLDEIDIFVWGGSHLWTAIGGILIGLLLLYIPDGDLKEIQKL